MAKKRLTLPKNFQERLAEGDLDRLKALFDTCDLDARGGSAKQSAVAFDECPEDLARWLVAQGADLHAEDRYGKTPLHAHAGSWRGKVELLVALGADVNRWSDDSRGMPLHEAAWTAHVSNVRHLLAANARVDPLDGNEQTPLERCLVSCSNITLDRTTDVAAELLQAGAQLTAGCRNSVIRIGEQFEFYREGFNPDMIERMSGALDRLYELFDVPPVSRRTMHDGTSPIVTAAANWEDRFDELWQRLVPSRGAARTVQGEVIRLAGKIQHELDDNGGVNWDEDFRQMAQAWLDHVSSGTPLKAAELAEAARLVADAKARGSDMERLCALAVGWVDRNPQPIPLLPPSYDR